MTDREIRDDDDALLVEAADWLVCLTSGEATEDDAARLAEWRAASPAHEDAFREIAGVRDYARVASTTKKPAMVSRRAVLGGSTGALAVLATFGLVRPPLGLWPSFAELTADHRTAIGERFAFAPVAGVKVEMNSRTAVSLIAASGDGHQGISLVTGEAFITAATLSEPFQVVAGRMRARASTARFNVQMLAGGVRAACVSGEVACSGGGASVLLRANEQVTFAQDGTASRVRVDGRKATAWRQGLLVFEGAPLADVVDQINLYRSGRIVLTNNAIGSLPVNAVFHTNRIDDAVPQIEQLLNLRVRHLTGGVVLMS
ncbi:FecR family protein [Brevundimonas diminuta]|uniref:FecR family protein n=1 Tax=Brevundimonas diminuta TaxID=293 RepID=UPI0030FCFF44